MVRNKTVKIAIPVIICVIAAVILLFFIPGFGLNSRSWEEYYELGMKYLEEENYEEAIVAFTSAIRVDDRQAIAYMGRGDAHMGYATQLEEDPEIEEQYTEAISDYEMAVELGDTEAELKLKAAQNALENHRNMAEYEELLAELYDVFASGDTEAAEKLIKQDEYVAMNDSVEEDHLYYDEGEGNGLGVYPNGYYYFGEWEDGVRSGHGIWMKCVVDDSQTNEIGLECYIFEGEWSEDKPNGQGKESRRYDENQQIPEGTGKTLEINGNYIDGLGDGPMEEIIEWGNGSVETCRYVVADGVCQPVGINPYNNQPYIQEGSYWTEYDGIERMYVWGFGSSYE